MVTEIFINNLILDYWYNSETEKKKQSKEYL